MRFKLDSAVRESTHLCENLVQKLFPQLGQNPMNEIPLGERALYCWSQKDYLKHDYWHFLVVQWLRLNLPIQ